VQTDVQPVTNRTTAEFMFACSKSSCRYVYSLDGGRETALGNGSASNASVSVTDVVRIVVRSAPPRNSRSVSARFEVGVDTGGGLVVAPSASSGNVTVVARVDGSGTFVDVRSLAGFAAPGAAADVSAVVLQPLVDGAHLVELRAVDVDGALDDAVWSHEWYVDTTAPQLSVLLAPSALESVPAADAEVVFSSSEPVAVVQYAVLVGVVPANASAMAAAAATAPWRNSSSLRVVASSLTAGVAYTLLASAVDFAGNVGDVVAVSWRSRSCADVNATVSGAVTALVAASLGPSQRLVTWRGAATDDWPFDVRVDGGAWQRVSQASMLLTDVSLDQQHTVDVRTHTPPACLAVLRAPVATATWFEFGACPGVPGFAAAPALSSPSVFGEFTLNCTCARPWFECQLNGGQWFGCTAAVRVGPLPTGRHTLRVHTLSVDGAVGAERSHVWNVVSSSDASLFLTDMLDGPHTLSVRAREVDFPDSVERTPVVFDWRVDTSLPQSTSTLLSPPLTNASAAVLQLSCVDGGVPMPAPCTFIVSVGGNDSVYATAAGSAVLNVSVGAAVEGVNRVSVVTVDSAGNQQRVPQTLTWRRDSVPPATRLVVQNAVESPPFPYPVVNATTLALQLGADDAQSAAFSYVVTLNGAVAASVVGGSTAVTVPLVDVPEGLCVVRAVAVDEAGNQDASPPSVTVLVDATPPTSHVVGSRAFSTATSTVSLTFSASGELPGGVLGFLLTSSPAIAALPAFVAVNASAAAAPDAVGLPTVTVNISGLASGRYVVNARAIDVAQLVDVRRASVSFTVDLEPPTCVLSSVPPTYVKTRSITLNVTVTDALSSATVFVRPDGGEAIAVGYGPGNLAVTVDVDVDGAHVLEVYAVDAVGNMPPPPYAVAAVTVDTVPPVLTVVSAPPANINSSAAVVCVHVDDSSAVTVRASMATVLLPSTPLPVNASGVACVSVSELSDGLVHAVVFVSDDAAGNAAAPVYASFLVDLVPPSHATVLLPSPHCEATDAGVVCDRVDGAVAIANKLPPLSFALESPEWLMWSTRSVVLSTGSACASEASGDDTSSLWQRYLLDVPFTPTSTLPAAVHGRVSITTVVSDRAGHVGNAVSLSWWIDSLPIVSAPVLVSKPSTATTSTTAVFDVESEDTSPGVLLFHYQVDSSVGGVVVAGNVSGVLGRASSPTGFRAQFSVSRLPTGRSYIVTVWAWDQVWHRSPSTAYSWQVIASAPAAVISSGPSSVSVLTAPVFTFTAVSADSGYDLDSIAVDATFEVRLLRGGTEESPWRPPCRDEPELCDGECTGRLCRYTQVRPRCHLLRGCSFACEAVVVASRFVVGCW
jgi:hypothetical protein